MEILSAILSLGSLGLLFGVGLALVSKKFTVQIDPRLERIHSRLPGANCGVCGQVGCLGFAEGLLRGISTIEDCRVMEEAERKEVANLLGVEIKPKVKTVAIVHCQGGRKVRDRFIYQGIKDCISANLVLGGQKECIFGCLGFGDCVRACVFGAVSLNEGLPIIDKERCTGCSRCVKVCPKELFSLTPLDKKYYICCKSKDFGKKVLDVCSVGCIGCGKCGRVCSTGAIHIIENLAVIDYNKCNSCGKCFEVCPTKCIQVRF